MAAKAYPYVRLVLKGAIGTGSQTWSTALNLANPSGGALTPAQLLTFLNSVVPLVRTWWAYPGGMVTNNYTGLSLTTLEAYYYPAGSSTSTAQNAVSVGTPLVGSGAGVTPMRTSLVATTLTGLPGRSFRGRMYLPLTSAALTAGQVGSSTTSAYATSTANLMTAINGLSLGGSGVIVSLANSRTTMPAILTVRVDSQPDTQRRRTDKITATVSSQTNT